MTTPGDAEPVRRPAEIEDITNLWFIHPLAHRLLPLLVAARIRPNTVSVAGMACGVLAGLAYARCQEPRWAIAGFVLMLAWHVLDGADGQLARLTHAQSHVGKVLDGVCDYVTFAAVYVGLAVTLSGQFGGWVWGVVALSGLCHAVQAAAYEMQREEFATWGWDRKSPALEAAVLQAPPASHPFADLLYRPYARVQLLASGVSADFHRRLAAILAASPDRAGCLRRRYREACAPEVRRWSLLSSNYRTLAIFACALAGRPLWYFGLEIFGFSLGWAILLWRQRARRERLLRALGAPRA
jgi:phosphatidylglycerophosphate synthase